MAGTRKTPQDWIKAGLKALRKDGPSGLQAETLSRAMGTTKGSFYWHFKDVPSFQAKVLEAWHDDCLKRFSATLAKGDSDLKQVRALAEITPTALDHAARAWGTQNTAAAQAVRAVDAQMLVQIAELMATQDATHPDFPGLILASILSSPANGSHTETLIDLLLVLR